MYTSIKLEKGLYNISGKSFTQALAELDPDTAYQNTELAGLDAYERQLKRFDIKVCGESSDTVEKFFKTTESAVLFPEFVRRSIKQGMNSASLLGEISAATTYADGIDYRSISVTKNGTDSAIAEGGEFPTTAVKLAESLLSLQKYGRKITTTYEAIRKQRLDLFAVVLKNIGAQISRLVNSSAVTVIRTGASEIASSGSELTYNDLERLWASMVDYNMTEMLVSPSTLAKILSFTQMDDCKIEESTSSVVSKVKTPYGVTILKCAGVADNEIIGIDSTTALETVFGTDIVIDENKLISTQLDEIVFSVTIGFSKFASDAVKVLTIG